MSAIGWSRILTLPSEMKAVQGEDGARYIEGFASGPDVDRQNEVVNQAALLRAYQRAGTVPFFRDHSPEKAIGYVVEYDMREGKVWTRAKILPEGKSALADDLYALLELGTPASKSIGFNPIDNADWSKSGTEIDGVWNWGGYGDLDFELLEESAVMIGASREADLRVAKGLGLTLDQPWLLTKEEREDATFIEDLTAANGRIEHARNLIRHCVKDRRTPSPEALGAIANLMAMQAEIVRAGRVLSEANRSAVLAAIDALTEVIARDDSSPARTPAEDLLAQGEVRSILDYPYRPRARNPLDLTLSH